MYNPLKKLLNQDEDKWNIHSSTYGSNDNFKRHTESYASEKYGNAKDDTVYSKTSEVYSKNEPNEDAKRAEGEEKDSIAKRIEDEFSKSNAQREHDTTHTLHTPLSQHPLQLFQDIPQTANLPAKKKSRSIKDAEQHSRKNIEEAIDEAISRKEENKIIILE